MQAPLQLVDAANKIWLLRANLFVADGCDLQLRGSAVGGDVNELRLLISGRAHSKAFGGPGGVVAGRIPVLRVGAESALRGWREAQGAPVLAILRHAARSRC